MTEKEYIKLCDNLIKNLSDDNAEDTIKIADQLINELKPLRLKCMIAWAEAAFRGKFNCNDIFRLLNGWAWNLYNYDGVEEFAELYSKMNASYGDYVDALRNKIHPWVCIKELSKEHEEELAEIISVKEQREDVFLDDLESDEKLFKLRESYFVLAKYVSYSLVSYLLEQRGIKLKVYGGIDDIINFGYLKEQVFSKEQNTFIIVASDYNMAECEVAATILSLFGKQVFLLVQPIDCPVDYEINMTDTVSISIENMKECEGVQVITPFRIILNDRCIGENRSELINYLAESCSYGSLATVLASGSLFDTLCESSVLQKKMERLYNFEADGLEKNLTFGWAGDYLTYISYIYGLDARKAIEHPAECDFSIVIPVRNSAYYLKDTLRTCLELRYDGSYEIVISDNSTDGNQEVYQLIRELDDPRIRYYQTPRDLHLSKSFEFAYLQAKGAFIFSIGADDGVLPWALEVLEQVLKEHPEQEIIKWDRGSYGWTGLDLGQEGEFIIPGLYQKDSSNIVMESNTDLLAHILKNPKSMYRTLPMLYINSGFRRSYFQTLMEKTGRLWDGICQDIYIGVINISIYKEIMHLQYPVTIAGMSNASTGKLSNLPICDVNEVGRNVNRELKSGNVGGYSMSRTERLLPDIGSDVSSLYVSLLRAVARGVLPYVYLEKLFDWKKIYLDYIRLMHKDDLLFDRKVHYLRYTATKHGEEFLRWFDESVYPRLMKPEPVVQEEEVQDAEIRNYQEGFQNHRLTLNASKFGVESIYDAVRLFEQITGL